MASAASGTLMVFCLMKRKGEGTTSLDHLLDSCHTAPYSQVRLKIPVVREAVSSAVIKVRLQDAAQACPCRKVRCRCSRQSSALLGKRGKVWEARAGRASWAG